MYIEYFNIMTSGAPGGSLALTISFTLIVTGLIFLRFRHSWPRMVKILPILALISLIGVTVKKSVSSSEYNRLRKVVINKKHIVTEGIVENFIPQDDFNPESFSVNGKIFSYSDDKTNSAFNEVSSQGGPIKNGIDVRIFYQENDIIGLWIKE